MCVTSWLSVCVWCVHVQRRGLSRAPGSRVKIKIATIGDGSVSLIQLLRRIFQTIRSAQRSIDVAVDVNSLQRNISRRRLLLRYKESRQHITCDVISFTFIRGRVTELCRVPINSNYAVYLFLAIYAAAKLDLWISIYTRILPRHNSEYCRGIIQNIAAAYIARPPPSAPSHPLRHPRSGVGPTHLWLLAD